MFKSNNNAYCGYHQQQDKVTFQCRPGEGRTILGGSCSDNVRFPAWKNESLDRMCVQDSSVALS